MDREQFAAYARTQVAAADQILSGHRPAGGMTCSCGRSRPCPVAETCTQRREHFAAALALAEQTQRLSALSAGNTDAQRQHDIHTQRSIEARGRRR